MATRYLFCLRASIGSKDLIQSGSNQSQKKWHCLVYTSKNQFSNTILIEA